MADPDTYNRIVLKMATPFTKLGETGHIWSVKFSLSGVDLTSSSDAEATALDLFAPIKHMTTGETSLVNWLYYKQGSEVNTYQGSYSPGTHSGDLTAYSGSPTFCQLEVCALARCPVGVNSKGRAKYLFKYIHDISQSPSPGELSTIADETTLLAPWNTGSGPNELVPVDPTTGLQGTGWTIHPALYTRQLRRGQPGKA